MLTEAYKMKFTDFIFINNPSLAIPLLQNAFVTIQCHVSGCISVGKYNLNFFLYIYKQKSVFNDFISAIFPVGFKI